MELTLLESGRRLMDGELAELYAYPSNEPWVRANFIASIDGGATVNGTTGRLGGSTDRFLFNVLRELADVILVGAGTVRIEGYSGARPTLDARHRRQARGQSEVPPLAIVSKSGHLDRDMAVFTRTEVPPLVLTCGAVAEETRRRLAGLAEVIDCSAGNPDVVDEAALLAALIDRGLPRVLTEGGPMLFGSLVEREMLDELCLTIAPCVVGGQAERIASGPGQVHTRMHCAHILRDEDGYLYTRYVRH
ncbi:putative bifunctional enzyme riboflavin biosynthesis protein RibD: diaminohydroxyphosphoribosylaminopyrimidine deaminase (riboflavin-specific deaminase) + 5-amino-6-(5-phosphoribosylamino)uracil reductase (HTP reductase) [Mycobacterium tuberculosis H37Rv] [Mycobacterium shimoidei]|uniref:Bacterial bifunctional deaminase-reductase C-terminal domain-containing protein n=1 Tax=Mycobacterium shimoidei TaxID=29313 RepID=A0A375Z3Y3_MYCSH|nr:pyrimidine reductase family protein [Mycobacterium shimoidei]SRX95705.1 putative bifunctional enzyme riboflavin biosynthesis protein RibD: diaminohydroxyphosphoribosylaminopyrimidine deaminase (riboflavin-specific deaminase) + 5-amino-6-(5-phosphoribosylamino)uracil reductase (HTP reductase) [Mycobacterium tuberculosis H37Rv] [Mycobacterium shimoidei]